MASKQRGGYRENGGRPREWQIGKADAYIRIPAAIKDEVMRLARELDRRKAEEGYSSD